jgi:CRP/FNR family cyclic AMP-dependent transcriptional regulator
MRSSLIMFDELTDDDVSVLIHSCEKLHFKAQDVVLDHGRKGKGIFIILQGQCRVETVGGLALDTLQSGDIVGEVSFVDQRNTVARVIALGDLTAAVVYEDVLREWIGKDSGFAARFFLGVARTLAYRLRLNLQVALSKDADVFSTSQEFSNQIDMEDLDAMTIAGARLAYLLKRLL